MNRFSRNQGNTWLFCRASVLMAAMMDRGRAAGAIRAFQASDCTSMPLSFSVGTSGRNGERAGVDTRKDLDRASRELR